MLQIGRAIGGVLPKVRGSSGGGGENKSTTHAFKM
jgi:hypothetical protein